MSLKIKNRIRYWMLATLPLAAVVLLGRIVQDPFWFCVSFGIYLVWYRPLLDMRRLLSLGVIEEKDAWRFFIPFAVDRSQYFKSLWLG